MTAKTTAAKPSRARKPAPAADLAKAPAPQAPTPGAVEAPADPRFFFFLIAFALDNGEISSMPAYFYSPNLSQMALERVRGAIIQQHARNAVITGVSLLGHMTTAEFEGTTRPEPEAKA